MLGVIVALASLGVALISNHIRALFKRQITVILIGEPVIEGSSAIKTGQLHCLPNRVTAILYTSMTANPVHKGHMGIIATAIDGLRKKHIHVDKVYVSLSYESYVKRKVEQENARIKNENLTNPKKQPLRVLLTRDTRQRFLEAAIAESQDKFQGVSVKTWDDQDQGPVDHPLAYVRLAKEWPDHRVYFIGGTDLCHYMKNWGGKNGSLNHVVIISRGNDRPTIEEENSDTYSRFVFEGPKDTQDYSSSAIQKELKVEMLPAAVRQDFIQLHAAAQT